MCMCVSSLYSLTPLHSQFPAKIKNKKKISISKVKTIQSNSHIAPIIERPYNGSLFSFTQGKPLPLSNIPFTFSLSRTWHDQLFSFRFLVLFSKYNNLSNDKLSSVLLSSQAINSLFPCRIV